MGNVLAKIRALWEGQLPSLPTLGYALDHQEEMCHRHHITQSTKFCRDAYNLRKRKRSNFRKKCDCSKKQLKREPYNLRESKKNVISHDQLVVTANSASANHLRPLNSLEVWGTRHKLVNKCTVNHSEANTFPCDLCGKTFHRKEGMRSHLMRHSGEKPYKCSICLKGFTEKKGVTAHLFKHTGERPYLCKVCGKRFVQSSHLLHHKRRHTGERPYSCGVCGKRFVQQSNLNQHERLHTGVRPYKCSQCRACFIQKEALARHMGTHIALPHSCQNCKRRFPYPSELKNHVSVYQMRWCHAVATAQRKPVE